MINEAIKFGKNEASRRSGWRFLIIIVLAVSVFGLGGQLSALPARPVVVNPPCWVFSSGQWRNNEEGNSECVQAIGWYARYILNASSWDNGVKLRK
jgi:hypothetical protein